MSVDIDDPKTWTGSFVSANRRDCLITLQAHNLMAIDFLQKQNYLGAVAYLNPVREGLLVMHNEGCGTYRLQLATFSMCTALIIALGSFDAGVENQREEALTYLEYAKKLVKDIDIDAYKSIQNFYQGMIDDLKSSASLAQMRNKYDFPQGVIDILTSTNDQISP